MLPAMYSAVSGLEANQTAIDVIGNNIANVNTVGFKSSDVEFQSLFSQTLAGASGPTATMGGTDAVQTGLGVGVSATATNFSEGSAESTGQPLDVSIQGNGFLVLNDAGVAQYTRVGNLQLDANGDLVEPDGAFVQGWQATAGTVNTSGPMTNVRIPSTGTTLPGSATTTINLAGNINLTNGTGPVVPVTVYSANGAATTESLQFTQASDGTWSVAAANSASADPSTGKLSYGSPQPLSFNADGTPTAPTTVSVTDGSGNTYNLDLSSVSANAAASSVTGVNQDGSAPGTLQSYSIGANGQLTGVLSNGKTEVLGQLALANFANPGGLTAVNGTAFQATANSGLAQIGTPGSGQFGSLSPGTLEMSNVDLGQEFTNLIVAQRGYEANGKVVTTSDQILQDLINMKQ